MSYTIAYYDASPQRRAQVTPTLERLGTVRPLEALSQAPNDADVLLVGLDDLESALGAVESLVAERPHRQVLLLWEGDDPVMVIEAVRAGVRDVIARPSEVPEAMQRAWMRLATLKAAPSARAGKVVAVFSLKGGIGKTTLTVNLAMAMRRQLPLPITLVDMSLPCGNLDMYMDLRPPCGVSDVLAAGADLDDDVLAQALAPHRSGIRLLAGPRKGEVEALCTKTSDAMLDALTRSPGVVLVDLGSQLELSHAAVLERADLVLVPVAPLISSLGTMPDARACLEELGVPADRLWPVLNAAIPGAERLADSVLVKLLGEQPRSSLPWGGADVSASLNAGEPLVLEQPEHPLSKAVCALASDALVSLGLLEAPRSSRWPRPFAWLGTLFPSKGGGHVHAFPSA